METNRGLVGVFSLFLSRTPPESTGKLKEVLQNDKDFDSEFFGASEQDVLQWANLHLSLGAVDLEQYTSQPHVTGLEPDIIGIANARTATDGTSLLEWYGGPQAQIECPGHGLLPKEANRWYSWRIEPARAWNYRLH